MKLRPIYMAALAAMSAGPQLVGFATVRGAAHFHASYAARKAVE